MKVVQVGPGFAAEILNINLQDVAEDKEIYQKVRAAFEEHSVIIFKNQSITDNVQVAFSQCFGTLETAKAASLGEGTPFSILTNINPDGTIMPPGHKEDLRAKANQLWHTDSCFKIPPALASVLTGRVVARNGGETQFTSTRLAWDQLSPTEKQQLEHSYAWHDYAHSRGKIAPHLASEREKNTLPPVSWRMRWRNPTNGRDALYIASHTSGITGMSSEESLKRIDELISFATQKEFIYTHNWSDGDVVMWDNRATMHRGRPWGINEPRHMVRTTISASPIDGLDSMWPPNSSH